MKEIRIDSFVKLCTLLLLREKPHHGYEMLKTLEKKLGRHVSPGQIYPFLRHLQGAGYLSVKKAGSRDKKTYTLTKTGAVFLDGLLEKFGILLELGIKRKLKACAHCGCEVYRGGHRSRGMDFCCKNCATAYT